MSDTTSLLELIDEYSACVMRFIYMEDYFQNYPKTDYFTKATDQERRLWTERAKKSHPFMLRPIKANVQERANQLAAELYSAKIDCIDVLELSNLINTLGVDLIVVRMKWARVSAQLTQEKYKASPDGKMVENVSDSGDTMTVDEIAHHAECDPRTIQRDRKILELRILAQGERYSPSECLQFFRRRAGIGKGKRSTHLALLIEAYEKYGLMGANAN